MVKLFQRISQIFFFSDAGRIGRKDYIIFYLIIRFVQLGTLFLFFIFLTNYFNLQSSYLLGLIPFIALILLFCELFLTYLTAKRQHDLGLSSWPVMLSPRKFIQSGQKGNNQYGEEPIQNKNILIEFNLMKNYLKATKQNRQQE